MLFVRFHNIGPEDASDVRELGNPLQKSLVDLCYESSLLCHIQVSLEDYRDLFMLIEALRRNVILENRFLAEIAVPSIIHDHTQDHKPKYHQVLGARPLSLLSGVRYICYGMNCRLTSCELDGQHTLLQFLVCPIKLPLRCCTLYHATLCPGRAN